MTPAAAQGDEEDGRFTVSGWEHPVFMIRASRSHAQALPICRDLERTGDGDHFILSAYTGQGATAHGLGFGSGDGT